MYRWTSNQTVEAIKTNVEESQLTSKDEEVELNVFHNVKRVYA